ncbi:MAG: YbjQ family protein [Gemmataceae bacterium]
MDHDHHHRIPVTTANELAGYTITNYLGVVRGIVVRAQTIGQGCRGGFASILGGNIVAFEEVCEKARSDAFNRMMDHALDVDADAIVAMRYDATEFAQGVTEVLAYGTAVKIRRSS